MRQEWPTEAKELFPTRLKPCLCPPARFPAHGIRKMPAHGISKFTDILEADNGYSVKNWERGRAEEKSDMAHEANIIGYRRAFFCDKVR